MSDAQLDSFPVSQLQHRYNIVRSNVYTRLEALNIKPEKQGGRAYVNGEQLKLLDALDDHIEKGGTEQPSLWNQRLTTDNCTCPQDK